MQLLAVAALAALMVGHKSVVALGLVILIEPVELYQLNELGSILRIGSIASGLQTTCPSFIVGNV